MARCDVVVVDARGLSADRAGVRFELEQLADRLLADRVVLVVDSRTDRAVIDRSMAGASGTLRLVRADRDRASRIQQVFHTLLDAATTASPPAV